MGMVVAFVCALWCYILGHHWGYLRGLEVGRSMGKRYGAKTVVFEKIREGNGDEGKNKV